MKGYLKYFDSSVYAFNGKHNILEAKDIGICADIASVLTPYTSVAALKCFQGCPYTNTAFDFDLRFDGEIIIPGTWKWLPNAIFRKGQAKDFSVSTLTAVVPKMRTVVQKIAIENFTENNISFPFTIMYRGKTRIEKNWKFSIPTPEKTVRESYEYDNGILSLVRDGCAFRITSSLEDLRFFDRAYMLEKNIEIKPHSTFVFYISAHMGEENESLREAKKVIGNYENNIENSFRYLESEIKRIHDNLPSLSSDCPELDNLYYRSLVTYILCRWENPDLCALPYYSTGSINGACMCSYLWDYCGGLMMHPIYDPEGNKAQLRAYLRNDLTKSYALNPVTSEGVGPWYQINQEKIILMVYHHVLATGEIEFLNEIVCGKTVLEWMRHYAYTCDDIDKDVALYDYGESGNDHLEIKNRGNGPYNGVMPDLNARRYMNYMRVYELTKLLKQPDELLPKRAASLKEKLKELWNDDLQWYDFIDADGNRDVRYTVQMFKFLNSGVIDDNERKGLISHLNEDEFLSKFGLHSMSKLDPQYDQDDIDNGGGGICTHFTMQVCSQLYEMGYDELATDILRRVYWWGTRMPYMGDSCAANLILNREDTPLQGDISSVSAAQMIFFYIFGIKAHFDGTISISPVSVRPANRMHINNARLCGKVFSVEIFGNSFTVDDGTNAITAEIGKTIVI